MLLIHTFFKKAGELVFGTHQTPKAPPKRTRTFQFETLEDRDLLSASPLEPLALDFLANDTAIVFTPPSTDGTNSATTITTTPTTLETDSGTLAGTLTQNIFVDVTMQTTNNGWWYSETVIMSYAEIYDNTTYTGGYFYNFFAWNDGTETGFTFYSFANDDCTTTLDTNDALLTIIGSATSEITISSVSNPGQESFSEDYTNGTSLTTDFLGASGSYHTFESADSSVGNSLSITTLQNGDIKTTLIGYENVTLLYNGNGQLTSETDPGDLIPNGSSLTLTNYSSFVHFFYNGEEYYSTDYNIVSVETPAMTNGVTTYNLLSLTGSSTTTVFSHQEWLDGTTISYSLIGTDETYNIAAGNGSEGNATTSDTEWTSELDANGDWKLVSGTSHVFGHDFTTMFSSITFYRETTEQENINGEQIAGTYTVFGNHRVSEADTEDYDILETVSNGEWKPHSGMIFSRYEQDTTDSTTVNGDITITSNNETVPWHTFDSTSSLERLIVEVTSEVVSGKWETSGSRYNEVSGNESSTLTVLQETYQHAVDGMSVEGSYGYSERDSVDYFFRTNELFDGENWGEASGDGWTLVSSESGIGWYSNCNVNKSYIAGVSNGIMYAAQQGASPPGNGQTVIVISGTFTERGFESEESVGCFSTFHLVNGEWEDVTSGNVSTSTRDVSRDYELTTDGNGITIVETGYVKDFYQTIVGYDGEWEYATWGQATIGYEEYASVKVDYTDNNNGASDTFASSKYAYNAALVLMPTAVAAESYTHATIYAEFPGSGGGGQYIFAVKLDTPVGNEEPDLEWKTIFWEAKLNTIQEVGRTQINNGTSTFSTNGSTTEMTLRDFGGMQDNFDIGPFGNPIYTPPGDNSGNNGNNNDPPVWTPATQTYRLVDGYDWNITTLLSIDGMTGTKTVTGNVKTEFFSAGDGTACEQYDYTNTESGNVSGKIEDTNSYTGYGCTGYGCTVYQSSSPSTNLIVSDSSYSYSNSLTEHFHTDFEWNENSSGCGSSSGCGGWLITGGSGNASGARNWDSNSTVTGTTESQGVSSCGYDYWVEFEKTITSTGNYSDSWSSTSAYINGTWKLTDGTMSGSGRFYDETTIQEKAYRESFDSYSSSCGCGCGDGCSCDCSCDCGNGCGCGCGGNWHSHEQGSESFNLTHTFDEYFTITQSVENGDWQLSSRDVTLVEKSTTKTTSASSHKKLNTSTGAYLINSSSDHSSTTIVDSTKVFDINGAVPSASEWTYERHLESSNNTLDEYTSSATSLSVHETFSSSGAASGQHHQETSNVNGFFVTDATRDGATISGFRNSYSTSGVLTSSIPLNNGNASINGVGFYHGGDPLPLMTPTVMPQKADLPPPPPPIQQMPVVPTPAKRTSVFYVETGDEFIDNGQKAHLQHKADFAQGIADDAVTLADTAAGMTLPGGLYEAYQGETVFGGVPLSNQQRAIAATFTALPVGSVFAKAGGKVGGEITEAAAKAVKYNDHHAIPKFLGGHEKQICVSILKPIHKEFHEQLALALKEKGLLLPIGTTKGSREEWLKYFGLNPGTQRKAFEAVLNVSLSIDAKYGTDIFYHALKTLKAPGMVQFVP